MKIERHDPSFKPYSITIETEMEHLDFMQITDASARSWRDSAYELAERIRTEFGL